MMITLSVQRSVDALIDYVKNQLKNSVEVLTDFYDSNSQKVRRHKKFRINIS